MSAQTSEKEVVSRKVVIGLGIACIILLNCLVGAILVYSSIIKDKDDKISALNQQITSKDYDVHSLNSQVADLTSIVNLGKSTIWVENETVTLQGNNQSSEFIAWNFSANYAGYVSVHVSSNATISNSNASVGVSHTYVHVIYSSHGVDYDNYLYIYEADETVAFPVLPTSTIQVSIGNMRAETLTNTITITYQY